MCTRPNYITVQPNPYERLKGIVSSYQIPVPCGKCFECLSQRQNSFMYRAYREAKQYGKMFHLILTYDEKFVPIAKSLWQVSKDTGELSCRYKPSVIHKSLCTVRSRCVARYHKRTHVRLADKIETHKVQIADSPLRESVVKQQRQVSRNIPIYSDMALDGFGFDKDYEYRYVETRSYDSKDFQDFIRRSKLEFKRRFDKSVDNLRYMVCPEYGERNSRRPHMHCILINCDYAFAVYLQQVWQYGILKKFKNGNTKKYFGYGEATLKRVYVKCDAYKGDGFKNVASYVSKYACKGFMDNPAALQGLTAKMRVLTSKHFGDNLSDAELKHYLCQDLYDYNPEDISLLPELKLQQIVSSIISRLHFTLPYCVDNDGYPYKFNLPDRLLRTIFGYRLCKTRRDLPGYLRKGLPPGSLSSKKDFSSPFPDSGKSVWSAISYAVKDALRNQYIQDLQSKFESFISHFSSKNLCEAVAAFELGQQVALQAREEYHKQNLLKYLKHATI